MSSDLVPYSDMERMASAIVKSGLFGLKTPDQALALMLIAQAEGMHPAIAARDYDIIQGRPSKKAQAMLVSFQQNGGKVEWHKSDDTLADATFSHPSGGTIRVDWTLERAGKAGLSGKDNWKKFPRQMLRARVISEGVRAIYPGATGGLYASEEVQDFDAPAAGKGPVIENDAHPSAEPPYTDLHRKAREAATAGGAALEVFWASATADERKNMVSIGKELRAAAKAADDFAAKRAQEEIEITQPEGESANETHL